MDADPLRKPDLTIEFWVLISTILGIASYPLHPIFNRDLIGFAGGGQPLLDPLRDCFPIDTDSPRKTILSIESWGRLRILPDIFVLPQPLNASQSFFDLDEASRPIRNQSFLFDIIRDRGSTKSATACKTLLTLILHALRNLP